MIRLAVLLSALAGCNVAFGLERNDPFTCPAAYIEIAGSHYRVDEEIATWGAAEQVCELDGEPGARGKTHLAVFTSNEEMRTVGGTLSVSAFWIGHTDLAVEGVYRPVTTEVTTWPPLETPPWQDGQPNNLNGHQNCVWVDETGLLDDKKCEEVYHSVCECDELGPAPVP